MDIRTRAQDEWLALRCQAGDEDAFADLVAILERPLLYYATKLTRDPQTALDVLQDVWLRAFRGLRRLDDPSSLRPWLYRITHSIAVDRIRHNVSRRRAEDAAAECFDEASEPSFDGADSAAVHAALDSLELAHREVLVLFFLEDFTVAEIAVAAGCPEGTVKSRLFHAKRALKQILTRGGYGNE